MLWQRGRLGYSKINRDYGIKVTDRNEAIIWKHREAMFTYAFFAKGANKLFTTKI
jgi:hypothetical protein